MSHGPNFVASGNISTARFVTISGESQVAQSVIGDLPVGISTDAQKYAPIPQNTNTYAAEAGDGVRVFTDGEYCLLTAGTGGWTAGQLLRPDASGNGIAATTDGTETYPIGARAVQSASAGELSLVQVTILTAAGV